MGQDLCKFGSPFQANSRPLGPVPPPRMFQDAPLDRHHLPWRSIQGGIDQVVLVRMFIAELYWQYFQSRIGHQGIDQLASASDVRPCMIDLGGDKPASIIGPPEVGRLIEAQIVFDFRAGARAGARAAERDRPAIDVLQGGRPEEHCLERSTKDEVVPLGKLQAFASTTSVQTAEPLPDAEPATLRGGRVLAKDFDEHLPLRDGQRALRRTLQVTPLERRRSTRPDGPIDHVKLHVRMGHPPISPSNVRPFLVTMAAFDRMKESAITFVTGSDDRSHVLLERMEGCPDPCGRGCILQPRYRLFFFCHDGHALLPSLRVQGGPRPRIRGTRESLALRANPATNALPVAVCHAAILGRIEASRVGYRPARFATIHVIHTLLARGGFTLEVIRINLVMRSFVLQLLLTEQSNQQPDPGHRPCTTSPRLHHHIVLASSGRLMRPVGLDLASDCLVGETA